MNGRGRNELKRHTVQFRIVASLGCLDGVIQSTVEPGAPRRHPLLGELFETGVHLDAVLHRRTHRHQALGELAPLLAIGQHLLQPLHVRQTVLPLLVFLQRDDMHEG